LLRFALSGFGLEDVFASFWQFGFLASPFSELLITGKEKEFFSNFAFQNFVFRKEAFSQADIDRYIADQARPGRLSAGFAYYRALLAGKDFFSKTVEPPWTFPVLAIDGTTPRTASQRNRSSRAAAEIGHCSRLRPFRAGRAAGSSGKDTLGLLSWRVMRRSRSTP
jgi:hypothetical protein